MRIHELAPPYVASIGRDEAMVRGWFGMRRRD
jgi:hypothetical protein